MPKRSSKPRCSEQSPGSCCASLGNPPPSFPEHPPSTLGGSITLFALLSSSCRVSQPSTEEQEDGGTLNPYTASKTLQALWGRGHPHLPWGDGSSTPMQITGHSPPRWLRAARLTQSKLHQLLGPPPPTQVAPCTAAPYPTSTKPGPSFQEHKLQGTGRPGAFIKIHPSSLTGIRPGLACFPPISLSQPISPPGRLIR